jgi:hypothetical protein
MSIDNTAITEKEKSAHLLSLHEIAAWQVEGIQKAPEEKSICAVLPALQRGAVWSAAQAEALWDSLVRGFPVGAFLLAPFDKDLGQQDYKLLGHCSNGDPARTFHLLDGQQRATAIALGFFNVWGSRQAQRKDSPVLWVDLAPPSDERVFVFRVVTRSHPWGYQSKDPKSRLSHRDIAEAMDCFRTISGDHDVRAATLPLQNAWPWDAACPMPVALLIESATAGDQWREVMRGQLEKLPIWHLDAKLKKSKDAEQPSLIEVWKAALSIEKVNEKTAYSARLEKLMKALRREMNSRRIPGLILPKPATDETNDEENQESNKNAVETLFVRVNSAGTNLGGEELIYSLLKSAWPQAPDEIKRLQPDKRQVISPARVVTFLARLFEAWDGDKLSEKPPATPSVRDFRKTMHSEDKRNGLLAFVRQAQPVVEDLLELVLLAPPTKTPDPHPYRLPPTLTAQLFSGERGLDSLLMVSAWLMRLHATGKRLSALSVKQRQQTLGFIVAVNWFAEDVGHSLRRLWPKLRGHAPEKIEIFFNKSRFHLLLPVKSADGKLVMLPIVPPDHLDQLIKDRVISGCKSYPGPTHKKYWEPSANWIHYRERLVPEDFAKLHTGLQTWFKGILIEANSDQEEEDDNASRLERRRFAWLHFLENLWGNRRIVDYAQRDWLMCWFQDFDPTLPGQMDDLNRPWDYDHIHPQSLGSSSSIKKLPSAIREWHTSIGNLRAWPLELNRGDQAENPARKLDTISQDTRRFHITENTTIRAASFIGEGEDWPHWQNSVPVDLKNNKYLLDEENNQHRIALITAIATRFCRLYRQWHDSLALDKLM